MLVTLAVLLLMMTAVVKIFQAATSSLNSAQVYQELENQLRQLDTTLRMDLSGVTCKMTPPNDPANNPGYFEYGENEFADGQGEDGDDYIRFTAKAPAGKPFTGRMWIPPHGFPGLVNAPYQPITVTSEFAEIIYFLRNGNLYRRVLLVAPERQSTIVPTQSFTGGTNNQGTISNGVGGTVSFNFLPNALGGSLQTSWQGMNDFSAHPAPSGPDPNIVLSHNAIVLNTLGHLANRENRAFHQRFANDFLSNVNPSVTSPDNVADDVNGDNVPDYYPTLYPEAYGHAVGAGQLIYEPFYGSFGRYAVGVRFPYVFPGAYSWPQLLDGGVAPYGWIHSPNPQYYNAATNSAVAFDTNPLLYLQGLNHHPVDLGDSLPIPPFGAAATGTIYNTTWWGFPTWRETLSPNWVDPSWQVNGVNLSQPYGLPPRPANVFPTTDDVNFLPPMRYDGFTGDFGIYRRNPDLFSDSLGKMSYFWGGAAINQAALWQLSWEDDLIMTGVRSFDVKAYDLCRGDYADLGWGDDARITGITTYPPYLNQTPTVTTWNYLNFDTFKQTFAHEGRMPPLVNDNRLDASYPNPTYISPTSFTPEYAGYPEYSSNVGDNTASVVRLRRVWDSWSTDYTRAPANGVYLNKANPSDTMNGFPWGPPLSPPVYPSYPPPYPAPLRGIQIQVRVTDPTNQRIKTLTIRQDFTDKL